MIPGRKKALFAIYEFYQKTGIPLLSEGINGFGSFSSCDDPGYFFYVPFFSSIFNLPILQGAQYFTYLLCSLLFSSLVLLSVSIHFSWRSIFPVFLCVIFALKLSNVCDVYIASAAAFISVPLLLVAIIKNSQMLLYLSSFLLGALGAMCNLVRSYSLLSPSMIAVMIVFFSESFSKKQKMIALILLMGGYYLINFHYKSALHNRNAFLISQNAPVIKDSYHVFWHNIYIGLGFTRNDYGIRWDDSCAQHAIKKIDPLCRVGSIKGEAVAKELIFDFLKKDRHFFFTSLFARFGVVIMFFILWFGWLGLLCSYFYPKPWYEECAFLLALGVNALPGILAFPCFQYLTGFIACTVLYVVYSFSYALKKYRKNI